MIRFILSRLNSFRFAFYGIRYAFFQSNFKIQLIIGAFAIFVGLFLKISAIEWLMILVCIAGVLVTELLNSSIEELADTLHPNYSIEIKKTKDMAAAASLIAASCSFLVGLIIFIPKLCLLFS